MTTANFSVTFDPENPEDARLIQKYLKVTDIGLVILEMQARLRQKAKYAKDNEDMFAAFWREELQECMDKYGVSEEDLPQ